jgi:phosphoglycerate kinase
MAIKTLDELDPKGKRVLLRADLNVPMKNGRVTEMARIDAAAQTIKELSAKGARVIVLSHFGRPDGVPVASMSLAALVQPLSSAVDQAVAFAGDCIGGVAQNAVAQLRDGDVLLLENTRFHKGEEANDDAMADALASLGEIFVNDAFSCAHRAHASTEGLAHRLPAFAGRSMQRELDMLSRILEKPERPVVALIGGAKVSTKLALLKNLNAKVDVIAIGGAMANTFLKAQGHPIGKSLHEAGLVDMAREIMSTAKTRGAKIVLPTDVVVAKEFKPYAEAKTVNAAMTPSDSIILDIGSDAVAAIAAELEAAKTIVWNGPLGAFETPPFDAGTNAIARHVAMLTKLGALTSVAGGGDTQVALAQAGTDDDFTYISTAGGAFLEWLEGKELPGVKALRRSI